MLDPSLFSKHVHSRNPFLDCVIFSKVDITKAKLIIPEQCIHVLYTKIFNANLKNSLFNCGNKLRYIFKRNLTVKYAEYNIGKLNSRTASVTHSLRTFLMTL